MTVEDGCVSTDRLLSYLLQRVRQIEEQLETLWVAENSKIGDTVQWFENFLRELLKLLPNFSLKLERVHRSLQQKPTDVNAPPRSFMMKFLSFQTQQHVLTKALSEKNLK